MSDNPSDIAFAAKNKFTGEGIERVFVGSKNVEQPNFVGAKILFITALDDETSRVAKRFGLKPHESIKGFFVSQDIACIETGMGGQFVENALSKIEIDDTVQVVNVGYCGSNYIKKGTICEVARNAKVENLATLKKISEIGMDCYTSDVFVEQTNITSPCLFDMELFYICKFCKKVCAVKIVSDNLSEKQYTSFIEFDPNVAWESAFDVVSKKLGL